MAQHRRFKFNTLDDLKAEIATLGLDIPLSTDLSLLGSSVDIAGHRLANRLTVHPMEGFDADVNGTPGPLSFRRYRRYAAGGSALIWAEATAVAPEARSNPGQFCINDHNVGTFAKLVEETRCANRRSSGTQPVLILQLTHSGRYSKPSGTPEPIIAHHSPILDPAQNIDDSLQVISDDDLDRLQDRFVHAAELAARAGFDGVDVKSCHRYLLSELLASFTREGKYGGSFENRTRMLRETLARIRDAVPGIFVTTRMNAFDAISYPYGFGVDKDDFNTPDLSEPLRLVRDLEALGIPVLNVSIGNPYFNPHYGRPYDFPIGGVTPPDEHPLVGIARFLGITATLQTAYPDLPIIGSGYSWLRNVMPQVAAGVLEQGGATLIGQGRGAFAYPDSVNDIVETGAMDPDKCCISCSACTQIMRDGGKTGCVVRDSEIYGPQYRLARRFSFDRLQQEAQRCRDCHNATCTRGCPAHVDIPAFIKAFADNDIETAYTILKATNVLPEMCGIVCPAAEQCQGACLEEIFCEHPIPIQDIQLVVARTARLHGLTGVTVPATTSGRKVAVIGGGPAGIACTIKLLERGHEVTIFERGNCLGGTPDSTIPQARFGDSRAEVQAILAPAFDAGRLRVETGCSLGTEFDLDDLAPFDAVFLALGFGDSVSLGEADGVVGALAFLADVKKGQLTQVPDKVAVLGGGNTAMDAAMTARELGAADVYLVYRRSFKEMPAWETERKACLEAGVHFVILSQPQGYETDENGHVRALRIARTELGEPDASGRRRPRVIPDSETSLEVELVIEALGQGIGPNVRNTLRGIDITPDGLIRTNNNGRQTSVDKIFAGGDIVNGGTTAVQGIADGMQAADEIDRFMKAKCNA